MSQDISALLGKVDLFSDLDHEEMAQVISVVQLRSLAKDTTIFHAGDTADAVYIIASGKVKIVVTSTDGRDFILTVLGAGQVFGEMALLESAPRSAAVITASQVEVLTIHRQDFHRLLTTRPSISRKLLAILSKRLRRANSKMESLAYMDVAGRLARYLLDLARDHGQVLGNGWVVVRRPTHSDIAHSIGTSRETVSRMINEFEESFGLVNKGKFTYISEHLLD
ncbi:MAG: Crp/Fnr family transcriptional regulator [Acidobacteria bacterium]|nr:MAG: Crp/Fnr family transcriptional regulator [Acidobacteriota bacterium]